MTNVVDERYAARCWKKETVIVPDDHPLICHHYNVRANLKLIADWWAEPITLEIAELGIEDNAPRRTASRRSPEP